MVSKCSRSWALIVISIGLCIGLLDALPSFAENCGAYCKARHVREFCHEAIKLKGLKNQQRDVEFESCKINPMTHKQIQELADDNPRASR